MRRAKMDMQVIFLIGRMSLARESHWNAVVEKAARPAEAQGLLFRQVHVLWMRKASGPLAPSVL